MEWVRHHFIYHRAKSYLVIPNLYGCDPKDDGECAKALAMNQLAGVLDDMDVVRWPKRSWWFLGKNELDKLKAQEKDASDTDLSQIRKAWLKKHPKQEGQKTEEDTLFEKAQPIRNHGLFSKAERALTIAGWSERARRDIEILPMEDNEGLTPILMVLADDGSLERAEVEAAAAKGKSWWPFGREAKSA
jgi:hypothetical protein